MLLSALLGGFLLDSELLRVANVLGILNFTDRAFGLVIRYYLPSVPETLSVFRESLVIQNFCSLAAPFLAFAFTWSAFVFS